jgi:hypothetical protein
MVVLRILKSAQKLTQNYLPVGLKSEQRRNKEEMKHTNLQRPRS